MMNISIQLIPLKVEQGGCHMLIKSRINSNIGGVIIIDTGASMSAFDKETCIAFSEPLFSIKEIKSSGITNESLNAVPVIIKKIFFGRYSFLNIEAVLIDLFHINTLYSEFSNKKVIGLIGGTFLKKHNALIDYKNNKLHLEI
jgi:hypothetical protein